MKNIYPFLLIILFAGCKAVNPSGLAPTSFSANSQEALMIGTISIMDEAPRYNLYGFLYRDQNEGKEHRIEIKPKQCAIKKVFEPDYKDGNKMVYPFLIQHKPGAYEFTNYLLFENLGYIQNMYYAKNEFSIPVALEPGTITYVGNIIFYPRGNEEGYQMEWVDNSAIDLPRFKETHSNYNWAKLQTAVPTGGEKLPEQMIEFK